MPAGHVTHEVDATAPDAAEALPAVQFVQEEAELVSPKVPAAQMEQTGAAGAEKRPTGQSRQTVESVAATASLYFPALHRAQAVAPAYGAKEPAGQAAHAGDPSGAYFPRVQLKQTSTLVARSCGDAFPPGHSAQLHAATVGP